MTDRASMKWTIENITKESQKYESVSEWRKHSFSSYTRASQKGIYLDLSKNMKKWNKWNKDAVLGEALKYKTRMNWRYGSSGSYNAAIDNDWLEEAAKHMELMTGKSGPELEILAYVKKVYPNARKKRFNSIKQRWNKGKIELDVFIEELNKGIEFNGDYWHGKGFTPRSFAKTPEEYDNYKQTFFHRLNINLLIITETEWKKDKNTCLRYIDLFLGKEL